MIPSARTSQMLSPSKKPRVTSARRLVEVFRYTQGLSPPLEYHQVCPVARKESLIPSPSKSHEPSSFIAFTPTRLSLRNGSEDSVRNGSIESTVDPTASSISSWAKTLWLTAIHPLGMPRSLIALLFV